MCIDIDIKSRQEAQVCREDELGMVEQCRRGPWWRERSSSQVGKFSSQSLTLDVP